MTLAAAGGEQWIAVGNDVDVTFTETCIDLIYKLTLNFSITNFFLRIKLKKHNNAHPLYTFLMIISL